MASRKQLGWTVPGFGLPLRWPEMQSVRWQPLFQPDENTLLLSAIDGSENPKFCYTVRERSMLALISRLTDMPDWNRRVFDPDFMLKWKNQMLMAGQDVTKSMVEWCAEEVKFYVHDFISAGIIPVIDGGVIKSDSCIPPYLHKELKKCVASLPKASSEYRNNSDVVEDVVDPYLFPFAFTTTRTLRRGEVLLTDCISRCGEGEVVKMPSEEDCVQNDPAKYPNDMAWSRRFQYLPFDVKFNRNGGGACISSYINGVHPTIHQHFYRSLEKFIDAVIPMFNRTLIDLKAPGYKNQRFHVAVLGREPFIVLEPGEFRPPEQRATRQWLNSQGQFHDWLYVDLKREFWNIGIQMTLQVTEICLTPQKPSYGGEEWHIQGQMNERICASAIYVYSTDNVTPAKLSFRCRINPEEATLAKDYFTSPPWASDVYGARDGDPVLQNMGSVALNEGRAVTYPNTFQTKMSPFSLVDTDRSGHLKILTLHLTDPNRRALSTAMVPVQRRDWWAEEVRMRCAPLWRLPREVFDRIIGFVEGYPLGEEEGREMRNQFKAERKEALRKHTTAMEEYLTWDLDIDDALV